MLYPLSYEGWSGDHTPENPEIRGPGKSSRCGSRA